MLRIRELREEEGKTQSEMATLLCVSRQVYANYENGINEPSIDMLCRLADHFQCSIDYLIGRSDELGITKSEALSQTPTSLSKALKLFNGLDKNHQAHLVEYMSYLLSTKKGK